ncbi:MAG: hypothetical protein WA188_21810 [Terriglobales bacterium]
MPGKPVRCEHVKSNGVRCGSPALRAQTYCYFHNNLTGPRVNVFPLLEDGNAIQLELGEIIRALVDESIDTKRAALVLYALQIASHNLPHVNFEPGPRKVVLEPPLEWQCLAKPPQSAAPEPTAVPKTLSPRTGSDV